MLEVSSPQKTARITDVMALTIGRDLFLSSLAQEAQEITQLPESICRRAVIAAVEQSALPLAEAGKQLVSGLREQETAGRIVEIFWEEVCRLRIGGKDYQHHANE